MFPSIYSPKMISIAEIVDKYDHLDAFVWAFTMACLRFAIVNAHTVSITFHGSAMFCKILPEICGNIKLSMYAGGHNLSPGIHFFVKIGKFGILHFHEFAAHFYETRSISKL